MHIDIWRIDWRHPDCGFQNCSYFNQLTVTFVRQLISSRRALFSESYKSVGSATYRFLRKVLYSSTNFYFWEFSFLFTPNDTYNYTYTLKCYSQQILADKAGNKSLITNEKVTLCLFWLFFSYCFNELFQLFVAEILRLSSWRSTNSESTSPLVLVSVKKWHPKWKFLSLPTCTYVISPLTHIKFSWGHQ